MRVVVGVRHAARMVKRCVPVAALLVAACSTTAGTAGAGTVTVADFRPGVIVDAPRFGPAARFTDDGTLLVQSQGNPCATAPRDARLVSATEIEIDYAQPPGACWSSLQSYVTTLEVPADVADGRRIDVVGIHQQPGTADFRVQAATKR